MAAPVPFTTDCQKYAYVGPCWTLALAVDVLTHPRRRCPSAWQGWPSKRPAAGRRYGWRRPCRILSADAARPPVPSWQTTTAAAAEATAMAMAAVAELQFPRRGVPTIGTGRGVRPASEKTPLLSARWHCPAESPRLPQHRQRATASPFRRPPHSSMAGAVGCCGTPPTWVVIRSSRSPHSPFICAPPPSPFRFLPPLCLFPLLPARPPRVLVVNCLDLQMAVNPYTPSWPAPSCSVIARQPSAIHIRTRAPHVALAEPHNHMCRHPAVRTALPSGSCHSPRFERRVVDGRCTPNTRALGERLVAGTGSKGALDT